MPIVSHPPIGKYYKHAAMRQLSEQIEMSHRTEWPNVGSTFGLHLNSSIDKLRRNMTIDDIPTAAFKNVLHILGESAIFIRERRAKFKAIALIYVDPISTKISVWNFTIIFVAYFLQFQISLTLGFGPQWWSNQIEKTVYHTAYICLLVMLGLDMFINFHKGYYAFGSGKVIEDKTAIIKRYATSYFAPDIICIGLLIIPLFQNSYFLNYLQIISIILLTVKKFKCQAEITRSLEYRRTLRIVFTLGMLGCDVMLLGNFGACIFMGIDLLLWRLQFFGNNPQYYWLSNDSSYPVNLMQGPWIQQYVFAQSFSTGTLSTLAPGPFGKNPIEITYELFVMIFFMILASYVGEVLVSILYGNWQVRIFHENNIQKFDIFMSLKGVAMPIRTRIHNFFQLIWQFEIKNDTEGQYKLIDKLPLSLKQDVVSQLGFTSELKFVEYLPDYEGIQKTVAFKIKSVIVDPDATLFQMDSPLDSVGQGYIIFIKNGLAKFCFPFNGKDSIICLSNSQKLLGQYEFVTGLSHAFKCKSIDLSVIEKIPYSQFMNILRSFGLMEHFHLLKCKLMLYHQLSILGRTCLLCDRYHRENQCTQLLTHDIIAEQLRYQDNLFDKLRQSLQRNERNRKYTSCKKITGVSSQIYSTFSQRNSVKIRKLENFLNSGKILVQRSVTNLNQISDEVTNFQVYYPDYNIILQV